MRYYISGPMTGLPAFNFPAFEAAATRLRGFGLEVLSAHEIDHGERPVGLGKLPYHQYLRNDLAELAICQAVVLLPGWQTSNGARMEFEVAIRIGMPIFILTAGGLVNVLSGEVIAMRREDLEET